MKHYLVLVVLLISAATPVHPFSSGAPQAACTTLSPNPTQHGAQPQQTDIPYVLNLSSFYDPQLDEMVYTPNTLYEIVLESTAAAPNFRGFLIQPRLVADDSTVVGQFPEPPAGGDYRYSFCTNREGSVTHSSGSDKTTVTIPWMSPPEGTGTFHFGYAVVQTQQVYWANQRNVTISERPCGLPFYLDTQSNSCVRQCPIFTFGNHTTAQCQPSLGQRVETDATAYFGSVRTDAPLGTVVFPLRVVIDRNGFPNNNINAILVNLNRNALVEGIFRFSSGTTDRWFLISRFGGIDAVNASGQFSEIRLYNSRYAVYEDTVIYHQAPPPDLELPTTLDFDLNIIVVGEGSDAETLTPNRIGTVFLEPPPDPCSYNPCQNRGTCNAISSQIFTCACTPNYTGNVCDILSNPCVLEPCQNGGTCIEDIESNFSCSCQDGFVGTICEIDLDFCGTSSCRNGGTCVEGIGTQTSCTCAPGFAGPDCGVKLESCTNGEFLFDEKCEKQCPDGLYGDAVTKQCKEIADGYKLQLNASVYYASTPSDAQIRSSVLNFSLYLNNSYYQTPSSVALQLDARDQFTSYFSFPNGQRVDELSFSMFNPDHIVDPLKISGSIIYISKAPPGEYRATLTVSVMARDELGLSPQEDIQTSTLIFTVTQGSSQPTNSLRLVYYVIAAVGAVVVIIAVICLTALCWFCFTKTKRKRYYIETAGGSMTIENMYTQTGELSLRGGTWKGSSRTKPQDDEPGDTQQPVDATEKTTMTTFTEPPES